jgi:hypothetical protein
MDIIPEVLEVVNNCLQILNLIITLCSCKNTGNKPDAENAIPIFLKVPFLQILNTR